MRSRGPSRLHLRTSRYDKKQRQPRHPLDQPVEQIEGRGVGPVHVLKYGENCRLYLEPLDLPDDRGEGHQLQVLRRYRFRQLSGGIADGKQVRENCEVFRGSVRPQQFPELFPSDGRRITTLEPGGAFDQPDDWMQRRVRGMRRANETKALVRRPGYPLLPPPQPS